MVLVMKFTGTETFADASAEPDAVAETSSTRPSETIEERPTGFQSSTAVAEVS